MKYAIFMGCKIPYYLQDYGISTKAVLKKFEIKTKELKFNCCGYPNRDINYLSYILSSARNLAMAEKKQLDILTPCKCCFGNLKHAFSDLNNNESLKEKINTELKKEGLEFTGNIKIKHLLNVLMEDVGVEVIKSMVVKPIELEIAPHYGCHALRPSEITQFDDPFAPTIFEKLLNAIGAKSIDWPRKLECCGNPLYGKNNDLSLKMMKNKLLDARKSKADCIATACTYCQIQFDQIQDSDFANEKNHRVMPSVLYTQLLAYSMGLSEKQHGLNNNYIKHDKFISL